MPRCPLCKTPTDLIKYEGVPIYNCGSCGGHWVTAARLEAIVRRREIVMPDAVKRKMVEIADASDSAQKLYCFTCGTEMRKEQFKHWPEIRIDHCPRCDGIWLDRGELEKCQIYWEYMQDHPDARRMDVVARKAALDAEFVQRKAELKEQRERAEARRVAFRTPYSGGGMGIARILRGLFG